MADATSISERIRERKQIISDAWELAVRAAIPGFRNLDSHALCDHLDDLLEVLARWVQGDDEAARGLRMLADGRAVRRLGHGLDLEAVIREYAILRRVVLRDGLAGGIDPDALVRVDAGIDEAVLGAVSCYTRQRDAARDRLVDTLGHDLRNPLNAISIAAGRLLLTPPDGVAHRTGAIIQRSAERMTRMIKDVHELAREGIPISSTAANLGDLARAAIDELAAVDPSRDLRLEQSGDLEGCWDCDRVMHALSNAVANALEHGADPIRVVVREVDRDIETVVSNGGGVPSPESLAAMTDGLRLSTVRAIVRAHGAAIEIGNYDEGFGLVIRWPRVAPPTS